MRLLQLTFAALFLSIVSGATVDPGAPPAIPPHTILCDIVQIGLAPIVAISSHPAINGLQVTDSTTQASLVTNGFTGGYGFDGGIGAFFGCHSFYLNIIPSNKSYKQLFWQFDDRVTTTWSVGPSPTKLITAGGRTKTTLAISRFLACQGAKGVWFLYLQTGTDRPPGELCYDTQLQLK
ncbi:hypothetical protein FRB95_005251 [Tulasnella sp. JGI-2019a]|nr:hypothetical protein FRB95_005251 [Tulasnella sp. JGI-2019a]